MTIDCDGFDASIMPGTGSPSPGGFSYQEVVDLLRALTRKGDAVGFDFVEVVPEVRPTEITARAPRA